MLCFRMLQVLWAVTCLLVAEVAGMEVVGHPGDPASVVMSRLVTQNSTRPRGEPKLGDKTVNAAATPVVLRHNLGGRLKERKA